MKNKRKTFSQFLIKEYGSAPVNTAGSGAISGLPPDLPPVSVNLKGKKLNIARKKKQKP